MAINTGIKASTSPLASRCGLRRMATISCSPKDRASKTSYPTALSGLRSGYDHPPSGMKVDYVLSSTHPSQRELFTWIRSFLVRKVDCTSGKNQLQCDFDLFQQYVALALLKEASTSYIVDLYITEMLGLSIQPLLNSPHRPTQAWKHHRHCC